MVTYVEPFTPLVETYPYWSIINEDNASRVFTQGAHLNSIGWMECPCRPLPEEICHSQWESPASWKIEMVKYVEDDLVHYILYLHQTPIMLTTYQVSGTTRIFLARVFDSTGRMTKSTIATWNLFLKDQQAMEDPWWMVIRQKEPDGSKRYKAPYLFNLKTREQYPFRDGIMIEAIDVMMDWLNL